MAKKYKRNTEPTFTLSELEQYGFGDWLKKNTGWLAPVGALGATVLTGGLAAPAAAGALGAGSAGAASAGAGIGAAMGGAGAMAGTTAATAGLGAATGAATGGLSAGAIGAGLGAASKIGGAISQQAAQDEATKEQREAMQKQAVIQNNAQLTNKLQKDQVQNTPTFMCGGRLKKYPNGGTLFNPLVTNFTAPKGAVVDRGDKPILDESLMGWGMSGTGQELMDYGSLNNPKLYSDITSSSNPEALTAKYFTALKTGTNTPSNQSNPYMETFLDNANKSLGTDRGFFYNPQGSGLAHVTETTNPTLYKQLKERYTTTNPSDTTGKRLLSSGSIGVGNKELTVRANGGYLMEYGGASHAGGGIPVDGTTGNPIAVTGAQPNAEVEGNEVAVKFPGAETPFIFSDKLGFAKQAKKIQNKYSKRPNDSISQDAMYMELGGLMQAQEQFKADKAKKYLNKAAQYDASIAQFVNGGKLPTYAEPNSSNDYSMFLKTPGAIKTFQSQYGLTPDGIYGPKTTAAWNQYGNEYVNNTSYQPKSIQATSVTPSAKFARPAINIANAASNSSSQSEDEFSPYRGSIAPLVASGVGNLALMATNRRPDKINPVNVAPEQISLEAARTGAKEQAAISRANRLRALRESGLSAGQYGALAAIADADVNRATNEALRESYLNEQLQNAGYRQQANMYNAQQASQANMANMELQDRYRRQNAQYMQNIAEAVPNYFAQREKYDTLNALNPNYEIVKGKYGRVKFVPKTRS